MKLILLTFILSASTAFGARWYQDSAGNWTFSSLPEYHDIIKECRAANPEPKASDFYDTSCGPHHPGWHPSATDPTKGLCISDSSNRPPEYYVYKEAKDEAYRAYDKCKNSRIDALALASKPADMQDFEETRVSGDGYDDQRVASRPQPRVCSGLVVGAGDPCGSLPPGSVIHPDGSVERASGIVVSNPASSGSTPAAASASAEAVESIDSSSAAVGGSCDPSKKQEIFETYQKAARVLQAVYKQRFDTSGCQ